MTGLLFTVSLLCGCVLNVDVAVMEHADATQVREFIGGAMLAMRDAPVRVETVRPICIRCVGTCLLVPHDPTVQVVKGQVRHDPENGHLKGILQAHPVRAPSCGRIACDNTTPTT